MKNNIGDNSFIEYIENWLPQKEALILFEYLQNNIKWNQEKFTNIPLPRLTAWCADVNVNYHYSGLTHKGAGWDDEIKPIVDKLNIFLNEQFNSVLLNFYRGPRDSISFHSDDERDLEENPTIAALSLGGVRTLTMVHKKKQFSPIHYDLNNGSLFIMSGECQKHWFHGIKKFTGNDSRISLTFRKIISKS